MAQIIIDVNDNIAADVRDTLCDKWGYQAGNKMTFLKTYIAAWIKKEYREYKAESAVVLSVDQVRAASISLTQKDDIQ